MSIKSSAAHDLSRAADQVEAVKQDEVWVLREHFTLVVHFAFVQGLAAEELGECV